jgi:hypothetical protein
VRSVERDHAHLTCLTCALVPDWRGGGRHDGSPDDPQPEVRRLWHVGYQKAFKRDVGSARALEQPGAVAEKPGRDTEEDLVEHALGQALRSDLGAEEVDVPLTRGSGLAEASAPSRSPTKVTPGTGLSHGWSVSTNCGPVQPPPNGWSCLLVPW